MCNLFMRFPDITMRVIEMTYRTSSSITAADRADLVLNGPWTSTDSIRVFIQRVKQGDITVMASSKGQPKMAYTYLGKSGLKVSNICLGTVTFGKRKESQYYNYPTQLTEEKAINLLNRFAELGGNFVDTSDNYGYGHAEEIVGTWLQSQQRESIVISTKVRFCTDGSNVNSGGLSRKHMINSCEESLERLQTSYIDLYQAHMWDSGVPLEETLQTFNDLIKADKIRYFGFSNVCGWQLQKIVETCKRLNINPCITLQQQYNLLTRHPELEELQVCKNEGIGVLPWSPLKGGVLTGKFKRGERIPVDSSRIGYINANRHKAKESAPSWTDYSNDDSYWDLMDTMGRIAGNHGRSIPQVALRWLLQKDVVSSVITGATSVEQLQDNMAASSGWKLTPDDMQDLDSASHEPYPYPYSMIIPNNRHHYNRCNTSGSCQV